VCAAEMPLTAKIGKGINLPHGANGVIINQNAWMNT
jgi:serine acetyltransferase